MDPIAERMKHTGFTRQQVEAELEMMKAAAERFNTGKLTAADRAEIKRGTRDFYDRGGHCWRGR